MWSEERRERENRVGNREKEREREKGNGERKGKRPSLHSRRYTTCLMAEESSSGCTKHSYREEWHTTTPPCANGQLPHFHDVLAIVRAAKTPSDGAIGSTSVFNQGMACKCGRRLLEVWEGGGVTVTALADTPTEDSGYTYSFLSWFAGQHLCCRGLPPRPQPEEIRQQYDTIAPNGQWPHLLGHKSTELVRVLVLQIKRFLQNNSA